jgi:glycerophosphoryl diester phosphodiesterase
LALSLLIVPTWSLLTEADYFYNKERLLVIAHRGSSGHFPEHTIGAYTDAYVGGADFVELDLQITSDGILVAQHDPTLKETTNIEMYEMFQLRKFKRKVISGKIFTNDFLLHDFTLTELKMLQKRQRFDNRSPFMNDMFTFMSLEGVIRHMFMLKDDMPRAISSDV